MFTSYTLPTDGSVGPFPIGINYLDGDTLAVTLTDLDGISNPSTVPFVLNGSKTTDKPAGTTFSLVTAVAVGKLVTIRKVIDMDTPVLDWNTSAELSKQNLRKNTINLMEMAQAAYDVASTALERNGEVIELIDTIIPQNVIDAAAAIAADRVAAEAAAVSATGAAATISAFAGTHLQQNVELDFGSSPYTKTKTFVVAVTGVTTADFVRCTQVLNAPTGKSQDENEMDIIICRAACLTDGQVTIYAESRDGSVVGKFKFVITF